MRRIIPASALLMVVGSLVASGGLCSLVYGEVTAQAIAEAQYGPYDLNNDAGTLEALARASASWSDGPLAESASSFATIEVSSEIAWFLSASVSVTSAGQSEGYARARANVTWSDTFVFDDPVDTSRELAFRYRSEGIVQASNEGVGSAHAYYSVTDPYSGKYSAIELADELTLFGDWDWDSFRIEVFEDGFWYEGSTEFTAHAYNRVNVAVYGTALAWASVEYTYVPVHASAGSAGPDPAALPSGLYSITFRDTGLTPEEEGIAYHFESGASFVNPPTVPEPSTLALLTMGTLTLTFGWWRRRR
jgi:hypothetical protein